MIDFQCLKNLKTNPKKLVAFYKSLGLFIPISLVFCLSGLHSQGQRTETMGLAVVINIGELL